MQRLAGILAAMLVVAACTDTAQSTTPTTSVRPSTSHATTTSTTSTTTTTLPPTTTTEPIVVTPGIVKVANASGVQGAAAVISKELTARGFTVRDPTNALGAYTKLKDSIVFVVPGNEAVGRSVSRLLGGAEIRAMTTPAWITDGTAGLGDATVLVMLGTDRARKHLEPIGV